MRTKNLLLALLSLSFLLRPIGSFAATGKTLYNFTGGADGAFPFGSVVFDAKGNLYLASARNCRICLKAFSTDSCATSSASASFRKMAKAVAYTRRS